jgi:hypothetical protein
MALVVMARRAAARLCRVDMGSEYSRGDVGSFGTIGSKKPSELSICIMKDGKVSQHPVASAIREHSAPLRRWVQMENRSELRSGTWYTLRGGPRGRQAGTKRSQSLG